MQECFAFSLWQCGCAWSRWHCIWLCHFSTALWSKESVCCVSQRLQEYTSSTWGSKQATYVTNKGQNTGSSCISWYNHSFTPLACAECNDSSSFSGASSIPLHYVLFPATPRHQLFFHPLSPHLAINFLVFLLFPNSYIIPFWELHLII